MTDLTAEDIFAIAQSFRQFICRSGHVTEYDVPLPPDPSVIAAVGVCLKCGGAAVWKRKRPEVTVIRNTFNPLQR